MDYDETKQNIDTVVQNIDPEIDTSDGTLTNLIIAGCAAVISAVYGYVDMVLREIFPDLCSVDALKKWALSKRVNFDDDTPEDELRSKVLESFRTPPGGGDLVSYQNAVEGDKPNTIYAIFENARARGLGSMDIVFAYNSSPQEVSAASVRVENMRVYGLADVQISTAQKREVEIKISCVGFVDSVALNSAIIRRFGEGAGIPGADLFRSVIEAVAVQYGAADAKMFWLNDDKKWIEGTCVADKTFKDKRSVYQHLVVSKCFVELG